MVPLKGFGCECIVYSDISITFVDPHRNVYEAPWHTVSYQNVILRMLIEEYVTEQPRDHPEDVDLLAELSTMPRTLVEANDGDCRDQVSVLYRPDEFVAALVEDQWDDYHETPVETTVLVVDEDETITRADIEESRFN